MHFLIDADLPRSVGPLLRSYGHEATDVCDIGMRSALDGTIAQHAQRAGWCLLTGDFDFSDIQAYLPDDQATIDKVLTASEARHKLWEFTSGSHSGYAGNCEAS